jgi:hypothetical protein
MDSQGMVGGQCAVCGVSNRQRPVPCRSRVEFFGEIDGVGWNEYVWQEIAGEDRQRP